MKFQSKIQNPKSKIKLDWRVMKKLILLALLLTLPLSAQKFDRESVRVPYQKFVLDNGLTLLVHTDHSVPIVAVNSWYHVGSRNEKRGKTGFAHMFEHFFFNGSENYPHGFREGSAVDGQLARPILRQDAGSSRTSPRLAGDLRGRGAESLLPGRHVCDQQEAASRTDRAGEGQSDPRGDADHLTAPLRQRSR